MSRRKIEDLFEGPSEVIYKFDIAHVAWECDSEGYIVKDSKGNRYLVLTNHGSYYIADKKEMLYKVSEYQKLSEQALIALLRLIGKDEEG